MLNCFPLLHTYRHILSCYKPTFARRTSGYLLGTIRAVNFSDYPPPFIIISVLSVIAPQFLNTPSHPSFMLSLSLSLSPSSSLKPCHFQAVGRRPLTAEARVRSQTTPRKICNERSDNEKWFPPVCIITLMLHTHLHADTTPSEGRTDET
jgi:hypothetical protein